MNDRTCVKEGFLEQASREPELLNPGSSPETIPFQEQTPVQLPEAKAIADLVSHREDDPDQLLGIRYLCRGAGMLLAGPTGIGKSSFVMQATICWGLGQPFMGIQPSGFLRTLIVQAENDEGDLAEMRDGVYSGLNLTDTERTVAGQNVRVACEDMRTGSAFFAMLDGLLRAQPVDILVIDPALAYLGGETSSQRDVGAFLRNGLNPLLRQHRCGGIVVHHTNKPPSGQEKSEWKAGDFAYLGSGSAEWANWARAVLGIRAKGSHDQFELVAGKRGGRLRWHDAAGAPVYARPIAHHREPGVICWLEGTNTASAEPASGARHTPTLDEFLTIFPKTITQGRPESAVLTTDQIKAAFLARGWDKNAYKALRDDAEARGLLITVTGKFNRKYCSRPELAKDFMERAKANSDTFTPYL